MTEKTANVLKNNGFTVVERGLIKVKGKGELMTYFLEGEACGGMRI